MASEPQPCTCSWNSLRISFTVYGDARLLYTILPAFRSTFCCMLTYNLRARFNDYFSFKLLSFKLLFFFIQSLRLKSNRRIFSLSSCFKSSTHLPTLPAISFTSYKNSSRKSTAPLETLAQDTLLHLILDF